MYKKFISFFITIFFSLTIGKVSYSSDKEKEPEVEESRIRSSHTSKIVHGELQQIADSDHPFFKTVLSLECDFGEESAHGTAFLIDEHFALTAAHVVFNETKGLAKKITCHFASSPKSKFYATSFSYYRYYQYICSVIASRNQEPITSELEKEKIRYDYALIYFKEGLFRNSLKVSEDLINVNYAGYPSDRAEQNIHIAYGVLNKGQASIIKVEDGIVVLKSKVLSGMSGGPVILNLDYSSLDRPMAIISATRDLTFSRYSVACLLTSDKLANIDKWKKILAADQYKKFDSASTAIEEGIFCKIDITFLGINIYTLGSLYNKFIGN